MHRPCKVIRQGMMIQGAWRAHRTGSKVHAKLSWTSEDIANDPCNRLWSLCIYDLCKPHYILCDVRFYQTSKEKE